MGITAFGRGYFRDRIGSNVSLLSHGGIGSGSGLFNQNISGLLLELDRNQFSGTKMDLGSTNIAVMLTNWASSELSGLTIREAGVFVGATGSTVVQKVGFAGITFTGRQEFQYEVQIKVAPTVTNPNNTYTELFTNTKFKDVANTTANWNTTLGRLSLT